MQDTLKKDTLFFKSNEGLFMPTNETLITTDEADLTFADFDKLNLKSFATQSLLQSIEKGVASPIGEKGAWTISLNAEFGNGKTTFLKMFQNFIETNLQKKQDYNVIFINAWESDFYGEPIIAILSEFVELILSNQEIQEHKLKELEAKIKKISSQNITDELKEKEKKALLKEKREIKNQIKNKNKTIDFIKKFANYKTISSAGLEVANQLIKIKTGFNIKEIIHNMPNQKKKQDNILDELKEIKSKIKELKTMLQDYTKQKKLIIIVDELDRARPDYAVHFLEDIKHFFDIPNVIFIVGVNRQQMEATVKCLYGESLNFEGYYRKFFKQEIDLPDPYKEAQKFVNTLIKEIDLPPENHNIEAYLSCKTFNLTLREIEMFMRIFDMILGVENKNINWMQLDCYCFLICLSIKEKEEFNKILDKNYTVNQFLKFLSNKTINYTDNRFNINSLLVLVAISFIKNQDCIDKEIENIFSIFKNIDNVHDIYNKLKYPNPFDQPALIFCQNITKFNQTKKHTVHKEVTTTAFST